MKILHCIAVSIAFFPLFAASAGAQWNPLNPVTSAQPQPDGALLQMRAGVLRVQACADSIVRAAYSPHTTFPSPAEYVVTQKAWPASQWRLQSTENHFLGMVERRTFNVVRVGDGQGVGVEPAVQIDRTLEYPGDAIRVTR